MKTIVENKLDENSELYNAFSKITAEKFAEFYSKIVSKETLDEIESLNVEIEIKTDLLRKKNFCVEFRPTLKQNDGPKDNSFFAVAMKINQKLKYIFSFDLFKLLGVFGVKRNENECTALWRQFLTENLGEKFYRTLLAEHIKQSIDARKSVNEKEHKCLVAQLAENKQKEQELADVLDDIKNSNGEVITSSETKTD